MRTLHLSIIAISAVMILIVIHYANASCATSDVPCNDLMPNPTVQTPHLTTIDGTVTLKGCNVINGNITQATDIQNTTIQVCNYHSKHFKISQDDLCVDIGFGMIADPDTGHLYRFPEACHIPSTCGLKNSWGGPQFGHEDRLPVTIGGKQVFITTFYHAGICPSESYSQEEKKVSIIADGLWTNSTMTILVPKALVENVTAVKVDGKSVIPSVTDYPTHDAVPACPESCYSVEIPLTISPTPAKIEIGAESIPEFPLTIPVLLIGITSLIVFYRMKFRK